MDAYKQKVYGKYQVKVFDSKNRLVKEYPVKPNLVLDYGLDEIASNLWADCWRYCAVGTGTTPTSDDSGLITATQSGTTVTAGSSFFSALDVGKLLVFDTGERAYILSHTSGTQVEVSVSRTVGSSTLFTMWRVDQTQHTSYVQHSTTINVGSAFNRTDVLDSGATLRMKRTWKFPSEAVGITYHEVGFHRVDESNPFLFSRVVSDEGFSVSEDQFLVITYELTVNVGSVDRVSENLSINGWPIAPTVDTDAETGFCTIPLTAIDSNGDSIAHAGGSLINTIAETSNSNSTFDLNTNNTFPPFGTNPTISQSNFALALEPYVSGSFERNKTWRMFGVPTGNQYRQLVHTTVAGGNSDVGWMALFDSFQTMEQTHSLNITLRWAWDRVLNNP